MNRWRTRLRGRAVGFQEADDDPFEAEEEERHPLLQQAMDLLVRLDSLFGDEDPRFAPSLRHALPRRRRRDGRPGAGAVPS